MPLSTFHAILLGAATVTIGADTYTRITSSYNIAAAEQQWTMIRESDGSCWWFSEFNLTPALFGW